MANAVASKPAANGTEKTYGPRFELTLWKPNREGKGAAAILQFSPAREGKDPSFWLTMMPETGNESGPKFDKTKSLSAKLGLNDIGEILAVCSGRTQGLGKKNEKGYWTGLFHKSGETNSTVITLNKGNTDGDNFFLAVSAERDGQKLPRYNVSVTPGEMELVRRFIETYISDLFVS
jgi:hypothetical protein